MTWVDAILTAITAEVIQAANTTDVATTTGMSGVSMIATATIVVVDLGSDSTARPTPTGRDTMIRVAATTIVGVTGIRPHASIRATSVSSQLAATA